MGACMSMPPGMRPAVDFEVPMRCAELTGPYTANDALRAAFSVAPETGKGASLSTIDAPEDIIFDPQDPDAIYTGDACGSILRVMPDSHARQISPPQALATTEPQAWPRGQSTEWAYVGGRPLGGAFDANGDLILCEPVKGLIKVDRQSKAVTILTQRVSACSLIAPGTPLRYVNDLDISARNGRIYFSDSAAIPPIQLSDGSFSTKRAAQMSYLEGRGEGRLCVYDPCDGTTHVLADKLWFANGVALDAEESVVIVAETYARRLRQFHLSGPCRGTIEDFGPPLPGFPDNVSRCCDGSFWVAIPARQPPAIVRARNASMRMCGALAHNAVAGARRSGSSPPPGSAPVACVLQLSPDGDTVLRFLLDEQPLSPGGSKIWGVSSCAERNGVLYMASIFSSAIAAFNLSAVGPIQAHELMHALPRAHDARKMIVQQAADMAGFAAASTITGDSPVKSLRGAAEFPAAEHHAQGS